MFKVGGEVLPQVDEFRYHGVLLSEGSMEHKIVSWISSAAALMQ